MKWQNWKCFLGLCDILPDPSPINGVWYGQCTRCYTQYVSNNHFISDTTTWIRL